MDSKLAIKQFLKIKKLIRNDKTRLAAEWKSKYNVLIATILSAQTRDETTIPVCENLFKKYPSMIKLSKARIGTVEKIIKRVNYHKTKSKHIITTAKILSGKKIPETTDKLIKLPGVGRKVANVYLVEIHQADAIGVDTHVARISFKLGWADSKNPNKVEKDLEKLFPKKYWKQINGVLVRFGKSYGRSRKKENEILESLINRT
jgi:endonuclease III